MTPDRPATPLPQLEMLASALSGQPVAVAATEPGQPCWTNRRTIFVDPNSPPTARLTAITVQACLIAADSLQPAITRKLSTHRAAVRRYLAIEGHRALAANQTWLPPAVRTLIDDDLASRTDSPAASLDIALSRQPIPDPPADFGVLRPRKVVVDKRADHGPGPAGEHTPRRQQDKGLQELADDDIADDQDMQDPFTSPVGGGGVLGKLLARMLSVVRQLSGGGQPGADTPTHRTRAGATGSTAVVSNARSATETDDPFAPHGATYPEWNMRERRYRPQWCTVHEIEPPNTGAAAHIARDIGLRKPLARLGVGLQRSRRQAQGDDIDIDAAVEAQVETRAEAPSAEEVYLDTLRRRRDLGVLVLLDVSGSTAEPGTHGQTVHQQQRTTAAALTVALHDLGDRVALYAFASQGRSMVEVTPVKRFDDHLDTRTMQRLQAITPGAFSRLGAAIRHGTAVVEKHAGTPRRLLVVISDGLAYDHGYERDYGAADARRALAEARRRGTGCLCLTIGASTDVAALRHVFGSTAHATIARPEDLKGVVGPLFRSALRSAEARRRLINATRPVQHITSTERTRSA